jgi:hypothetical protein
VTTPVYPHVVSPPAMAAGPQTADPWDAPYFGGTVYFEYRAAAPLPPQAPVPGVVSPSPPVRKPLATDPWDTPYFGGTTYLRFPAFTGPASLAASSDADAVLARAAESTMAVADMPEPTRQGRRGWLARLFRR